MPSTKRYFTVLAFGLVLCLCGTLAAANGHEKEDHDKALRTTFPGSGVMMDPCTGADPVVFDFVGTNIARFREGKHHASIHVRFLGKAADQPVDHPIKAFLHAKAQVDPVDLDSLKQDEVVNYDIPFESIWVQKGSHSWVFSAYVFVSVDKDGIFATNLHIDRGFDLHCTDGIDANAPEHRFNHDNDENDDKD